MKRNNINLPARNWGAAIVACQQRGVGYVLATVMGVTGSTPREPGSKMVITDEATFDTIGGGQLEFLVIQRARELLLNHASSLGTLSQGAHSQETPSRDTVSQNISSQNMCTQEIQAFPLAASAGQCCGGSVSVLFESFSRCHWQVAVFGVGHVAQRVIGILGDLPCQVRWIDNRIQLIPDDIPSNVTAMIVDDPVDSIADLPEGVQALILTHDHALDYRLVETLLQTQNFHFLGMIGSQTKAKRFRYRLAQAGLSEAQISRLKSPVGLAQVPGKLPMEVAVSISAELIAQYHQQLDQVPSDQVSDGQVLGDQVLGDSVPNSQNRPSRCTSNDISQDISQDIANEAANLKSKPESQRGMAWRDVKAAISQSTEQSVDRNCLGDDSLNEGSLNEDGLNEDSV